MLEHCCSLDIGVKEVSYKLTLNQRLVYSKMGIINSLPSPVVSSEALVGCVSDVLVKHLNVVSSFFEIE